VVEKILNSIEHPPMDVFGLAESVASVVYVYNAPVDAACVHDHKNNIFKIFVCIQRKEDEKKSSLLRERVRFSTAHEAGHLFLGHFDAGYEFAQRLGIKLSWDTIWSEIPELDFLARALEREANLFAAELLMPTRWLHAPESLDDFVELRKTLLVSTLALVNRLDETKIMDRRQTEKILQSKKEEQKKAGECLPAS
jgi:hypothetical protein